MEFPFFILDAFGIAWFKWQNGKKSLNSPRFLRLDIQMNVYHDFFAVKIDFSTLLETV